MQPDDKLDYPVAAPPGVAPTIFRAQIIQTMATQYFNYMRGSTEPFSMGEAHDSAMASWDTEWPDDPEPRTLDAAMQVVSDDLSYWGEE